MNPVDKINWFLLFININVVSVPLGEVNVGTHSQQLYLKHAIIAKLMILSICQESQLTRSAYIRTWTDDNTVIDILFWLYGFSQSTAPIFSHFESFKDWGIWEKKNWPMLVSC